ncbi:MAG: hypothetical protein K2X11_12920 [Acetobacteraceae bacterium]|nr:hypothetical protein [Acetobacteraceae bacterium]
MKALLLSGVATLLLAAPLAAAPITGTFAITGVLQGEDAAGAPARLADAVGLDFCAAVSGPCAMSAGVGTGTGAFMINDGVTGVMPFMHGDIGTVRDIAISPFVGPVTAFLAINGLTFDLLDATVMRMTVPAPLPGAKPIDGLFINGQGIFRLAGFDDTPGTFTLSTQSDGVRLSTAFTFSGGGAALPVPVPAPAGFAVLGLGLAALWASRRKG